MTFVGAWGASGSGCGGDAARVCAGADSLQSQAAVEGSRAIVRSADCVSRFKIWGNAELSLGAGGVELLIARTRSGEISTFHAGCAGRRGGSSLMHAVWRR